MTSWQWGQVGEKNNTARTTGAAAQMADPYVAHSTASTQGIRDTLTVAPGLRCASSGLRLLIGSFRGRRWLSSQVSTPYFVPRDRTPGFGLHTQRRSAPDYAALHPGYGCGSLPVGIRNAAGSQSTPAEGCPRFLIACGYGRRQPPGGETGAGLSPASALRYSHADALVTSTQGATGPLRRDACRPLGDGEAPRMHRDRGVVGRCGTDPFPESMVRQAGFEAAYHSVCDSGWMRVWV